MQRYSILKAFDPYKHGYYILTKQIIEKTKDSNLFGKSFVAEPINTDDVIRTTIPEDKKFKFKFSEVREAWQKNYARVAVAGEYERRMEILDVKEFPDDASAELFFLSVYA